MDDLGGVLFGVVPDHGDRVAADDFEDYQVAVAVERDDPHVPGPACCGDDIPGHLEIRRDNPGAAPDKQPFTEVRRPAAEHDRQPAVPGLHPGVHAAGPHPVGCDDTPHPRAQPSAGTWPQQCPGEKGDGRDADKPADAECAADDDRGPGRPGDEDDFIPPVPGGLVDPWPCDGAQRGLHAVEDPRVAWSSGVHGSFPAVPVGDAQLGFGQAARAEAGGALLVCLGPRAPALLALTEQVEPRIAVPAAKPAVVVDGLPAAPAGLGVVHREQPVADAPRQGAEVFRCLQQKCGDHGGPGVDGRPYYLRGCRTGVVLTEEVTYVEHIASPSRSFLSSGSAVLLGRCYSTGPAASGAFRARVAGAASWRAQTVGCGRGVSIGCIKVALADCAGSTEWRHPLSSRGHRVARWSTDQLPVTPRVTARTPSSRRVALEDACFDLIS